MKLTPLTAHAAPPAHPDAPRAYLLLSSDEAASAADVLIQGSSPFALEPLPDDEWTLTAKPAMLLELEARLGREIGQ